MQEVIHYLVAAGLTIGIEFLFLLFCRVKDARLYVSLPLNFATNLLLNVGGTLLAPHFPYYLYLALGEATVFFLEWGIYQLTVKDKKNWQLSLAANFISFFFGGALYYLIFLFL